MHMEAKEAPRGHEATRCFDNGSTTARGKGVLEEKRYTHLQSFHRLVGLACNNARTVLCAPFLTKLQRSKSVKTSVSVAHFILAAVLSNRTVFRGAGRPACRTLDGFATRRTEEQTMPALSTPTQSNVAVAL
jgi:hypothetical protein